MNLNLIPNVCLVDKNGQLIEMINQSIARRLIRQGFCDLLMIKPATVQFFDTIDNWNNNYLKRRKFPVPSRTKESPHDMLKSVLYGNYHMQSPTGEEMFHTNAGRVLWYLTRDLIEIVGFNPPTLRFKNKTNGPGHINDDYYLTEKINQCVVCGCNKHLTRHHVVPKTYRIHFPMNVKGHSYHDILLVCSKCHRNYESEASKLKLQIMEEMGYSSKAIFYLEVEHMIKLSKTLLKYGHEIPEPKKTEMYDKIRVYLNKQDISDEDLKGLTNKGVWYIPDDYQSPSEFVASNITDLQAFAERWRRHFLETMEPKFLPKNWDEKKSVFAEK